MNQFKWLYPGMRVKRYIALMTMGILLVCLGTAVLLGAQTVQGITKYITRFGLFDHPRSQAIFGGIVLLLAGTTVIVIGFRQTIRSITGVFIPNSLHDLVNIVFERRHLQKGPNIVVVGGGTGLSTMLRGLKGYSSNLTAIVTVADDGGSSGRLRSELGIPPPGDIRNILTALADTEPLMERLFQYRFTGGQGLVGHNFGNLFIAAMTEITGDFEKAILESSKVLAVKGQVLPSTLANVTLRAEFEDGSVVEGESEIPKARKRIRRIQLLPYSVEPVPSAISAIENADAIILGPGSLYTSVLPNLMVHGIADAIRKSPAIKVYVCNVMTQPGETTGYKASDHVNAIIEHVGPGCFQYVIINNQPISREKARKYELEGAHPVLPDVENIKAMGLEPIARPLLSEENLVRHDPRALAQHIMTLIVNVSLRRADRRTAPARQS